MYLNGLFFPWEFVVQKGIFLDEVAGRIRNHGDKEEPSSGKRQDTDR